MPQDLFSPNPERVRNLLSLCPVYEPTPMISVENAAIEGILLVKDETKRMGLTSFKALGGVYAVAQLILSSWEQQFGQALDLKELREPAVEEFASKMTFICASAGNHGMSVAAGARIFGAKARIHLAQTVPGNFAESLLRIGAEVQWSGKSYEDSMIAASQDAKNSSAILLADGSWPGYTRAPSLIMEGYTMLAEELLEEFERSRTWPTHVFLQAGVGGLAAATAHMIRHNWTVQPEIIIVEPEYAPCLKESHEAGRLTKVKGPVSNMGRLDCKEASLIAFNALERSAVCYMTVSDAQASDAASKLTELGFATTPSGAAGFAARNALQLQKHALPLIIVSEGVV